MNEIDNIIKKYEFVLIEKYLNTKYYNLKSIENFIIHFNEIKDIEAKKRTIILLEEYLNFVSEKDIKSFKEAKFLFNHYILPVGRLYTKHCKFTYFLLH